MASVPVYRIHPGLGVARVGDSPDSFYIGPEAPAALPTECDGLGNPCRSPDGAEVPVTRFKDQEGRVRRQAARFEVWVHDDESPGGRPLRRGDRVSGGGNEGVLVDVHWRVHLANKKAVWYRFQQLEGEHGYAPDHPRRNAQLVEPAARQQLIIDPGPQVVNGGERRRASFSRDGNPMYAVTFPPKGLFPHDIDTLGDLLTDDDGRLLVLGGHGRSGSALKGLGQPRIDDYANNDGWFDDISDGPVMARLVMFSEGVSSYRFIDVDAPAWVLVGYPRYAPQILDMVTLEDVVEDLAIRAFAARTDLYGTAGTFADPERIDARDAEALAHWKAGRLSYNTEHRPWFWRDIWPILFRPDEFTYLANVLQQSNYPHNQTARGTLDPTKLGLPPRPAPTLLKRRRRDVLDAHGRGTLVADAAEPALVLLDRQPAAVALERGLAVLTSAAMEFAAKALGPRPPDDPDLYLRRWTEAAAVQDPASPLVATRQALQGAVSRAKAMLSEIEALPEAAGVPKAAALARAPGRDEPVAAIDPDEPVAKTIDRVIDDFLAGRLLSRALDAAAAEATADPYRAYRKFVYDLLRRPGEENTFQLGGSPTSRTFHLPLMPLLAGDNPISNDVPSKFLRLTHTQLFLLRQWSEGRFHNEVLEGWVPADAVNPWQPYASWPRGTAAALDRGVLANMLGGAFCPGGEIAWIIRNPAIWLEPYRLKADPTFYTFRQTAAQANQNHATPKVAEEDYVSYAAAALSQDSDYAVGLQPGDLTKMGALPWQADFNECSIQEIDVTHDQWNTIDPDDPNDPVLRREERAWSTLWWPAHRPMQVYEVTGVADGSPSYAYLNWSRGVQLTTAGDFKMTTEWSRLGFVVRNPHLPPDKLDAPSPELKYVSVERAED